MSLISRAIPGLFGGVSQAIPAMRHPTQCELQENALSTLVSGLFKRPGTKHVGQWNTGWTVGDTLLGNCHVHVHDKGPGQRWKLFLSGRAAYALNLDTGAAEAITYLNAAGQTVGFPAYLNSLDPQTAFRSITVADTVFIVNRLVQPGWARMDTYPPNDGAAWFYIRQAVNSHTYYATVNNTIASYTAPATGVVTTEMIRTGLVNALNAAGITAGLSTLGCFWVTPPGGLTACAASDTYGNSAMSVIAPTALAGCPSFAQLPPVFQPNVRVKITGADAGVDPYYVVYDGTKWVETIAPQTYTGFADFTMPYKAYRSNGQWYFQPCPWKDRLVGDTLTNPDPSFMTRPIRDIFFYRNRLGFLAGDSLCMSRSGDYYNFFGKTARDVLDSDPIGLSGSTDSVQTLDWAVPFNEQLLVFATSKQQFALAGGDLLSPNTARLVPTTSFDTVATARPAPLGTRVVFPSSLNGYTQLSTLELMQNSQSTTGVPIADHVPAYIPLNPRDIAASVTAKMLATHAVLGSELYVFKFEDDGQKMTQKAWQKFTFGGQIVKANFSGQLLFVTMLYKASTSTGAAALTEEVIDLSPAAADTGLTYGMRLDRRTQVTGATATGTPGEYTVTVPSMPDSAGLTVYRMAPGQEPVELKVVSKTLSGTDTATTLTIRVKAPAGTGTFVVGSKYTMRYTFTQVFMRDGDGVPVMDSRLKLLKMLVRYVQTGFFKVTVTTKAGGSYTYPFAGTIVGAPDQVLSGTSLVSGDFSVPVQAQAQDAAITIESDAHLPCCFPYAEWRGSLNLKSQR